MFTWLAGITLGGWIKLAIIAALAGTLMYIMIDYKTLGQENSRLKYEVSRLESNVEQIRAISDTTKQALDALDTTCSHQLKLFLEEKEILVLIEKAADPLSEAANWAVKAKPEPKKDGKLPK